MLKTNQMKWCVHQGDWWTSPTLCLRTFPWSVSSSRDHHLGVEGRNVGLRVFDTCEGDFWNHEASWYHCVHDRLGKGHGASPNWDERTLVVNRTLPHALQIPTQFLIRSAQLFIVCSRHGQIDLESVLAGCLLDLNLNQNPVLISFGHRHCLLEGANGLHELLHGDDVSSF